MKTFVAALALMAAAPAHADRVAPWRAHIDEASARFGIPAMWIERVMQAESAGSTTLNGRPITSQAGAMGLMQLMPGTWTEMRAALRLGSDPHDPRDNILAGTYYLRLMNDRFGYPGMFAAYNAGPRRYSEFLATGRTLPGETRAYLATVGGSPAGRQIAIDDPRTNAIFFTLRRAAASPAAAQNGAASGLFVALRKRAAAPD